MDRNDVNCTYNNRIFSHLKVSIIPVQNANFENNICEVGQISSNISVIKYDFKIVQCTKIRQIQLAISLTIIIINNAKVIKPDKKWWTYHFFPVKQKRHAA